MKRTMCMLLALLMCLSMTLPAMAAEGIFVPSVGPEVTSVLLAGEDVAQELTVTSVTEAKEQSTDISQESRDLLVTLYDALSDGSMELPTQIKYVEMHDLTSQVELTAELTVAYQLKVEEEGTLLGFVYTEEQWKPMKSVVYDGQETVTCVLDVVGPLVIGIVDGSADASEGEGISSGGMVVTDAPQDSFVPSITYKDGVQAENGELSQLPGDAAAFAEGIDQCIVVTSIAQAKDKSTDISQEDRDLLLDVYEQLENGTMTLPLKGANVIKELVDVSFEYEDCRLLEDHGHKDEILKQEGVTLTVDFKLGLEQDAPLAVLTYVDGQWVPVEKTEIGADGTVTCVFEDVCPVAFVLMEEAAEADAGEAPWTGDMIILWVVVMAVCAAGIVVVLGVMKKQRK